MRTLFILLSIVLIVQLVYPFVTILLAQLFGKERLAKKKSNPETLDYACIITAYRNAAIVQPLVVSLLQQTHPNLMVYLVADECPAVEFDIADPRLVYLRPETHCD